MMDTQAGAVFNTNFEHCSAYEKRGGSAPHTSEHSAAVGPNTATSFVAMAPSLNQRAAVSNAMASMGAVLSHPSQQPTDITTTSMSQRAGSSRDTSIQEETQPGVMSSLMASVGLGTAVS